MTTVLDSSIGIMRYASQVTPSDDAENNFETPGALYIGGPDTSGDAGDVGVVLLDGSTVVFSNVPPGSWLPVLAARVNAADTTATGIVVCH